MSQEEHSTALDLAARQIRHPVGKLPFVVEPRQHTDHPPGHMRLATIDDHRMRIVMKSAEVCGAPGQPGPTENTAASAGGSAVRGCVGGALITELAGGKTAAYAIGSW